MKDQTNKAFWERFSLIYSLAMHRNKKTYESICKELESYLKKDMKVLELACGTGQLSYPLCDKVGSFIATDFSPRMVEKAAKKKNSETITFEVADATNLSYADNSFDAVLIANALHIMPDPDKALGEIKRVLVNNGLLIAPTFVYKNGKKNSRFLLRLVKKVGFKIYHKWTKEEYKEFVSERGYDIINESSIKGFPLIECLLICKVNKAIEKEKI